MAQLAEQAFAKEEARKAEKPIATGAKAVEIARSLFGLNAVDGSIKDLDSYDDRNFYMRATHARPELVGAEDANEVEKDLPGADSAADVATPGAQYHFVLKIHNGVESLEPAFIECQNLAMEAVRASSGVWCPRAMPALDGERIARARLTLANGVERDHAVRCLPFRPGVLFADVSLSPGLLHSLGTATARVSASLLGFDHPAAHRTAFIWDLANTASVRSLLHHSPSERHAMLAGVIDEFESNVLPRASELRSATIHGDINDQNVLVDALGERVLGIIDFGDMAHSWLINEIAIAAAYTVIALHYGVASSTAAPSAPQATDESVAKNEDAGAGTPAGGSLLTEMEALAAIVSSYAAEMASHSLALTSAEWSVLPTLIACRITVSLIIGAYSSAQDPTNEYLKLTQLPGWTALQRLRALPATEVANRLRAAADAAAM